MGDLEFAKRGRGRDKKRRKRRRKSIAIGVGSTAAIGGLGYLALSRRKNKSSEVPFVTENFKPVTQAKNVTRTARNRVTNPMKANYSRKESTALTAAMQADSNSLLSKMATKAVKKEKKRRAKNITKYVANSYRKIS